MLSVVIPAYNEEYALPHTLKALHKSRELLSGETEVEVIVVDNGSTDMTVMIARFLGAHVVHEKVPGIGVARNRGAMASKGDMILFLDADVVVSRYALKTLVEVVGSQELVLGGMRAIYRPRKLSSWLICAYWDWRRENGGAPQGVAQFVDRRVFFEVGGYDESLRMSEDVDFYRRAREYIEFAGGRSAILQDAIVWPSCRRYDDWGTLKSLFFQHPFVARIALRSDLFWSGWRASTVR